MLTGLKSIFIFFLADCQHNGKFYPAGKTFKSGDGCNDCTCLNDGTYTCTEFPCYPGNIWLFYFVLMVRLLLYSLWNGVIEIIIEFYLIKSFRWLLRIQILFREMFAKYHKLMRQSLFWVKNSQLVVNDNCDDFYTFGHYTAVRIDQQMSA